MSMKKVVLSVVTLASMVFSGVQAIASDSVNRFECDHNTGFESEVLAQINDQGLTDNHRSLMGVLHAMTWDYAYEKRVYHTTQSFADR